jgi:hypothetical protein
MRRGLFRGPHEFYHHTLPYQERRVICRDYNFDHPLIAGFSGAVRFQLARAEGRSNSNHVSGSDFARVDLRNDLGLLTNVHVRYRALNDLRANDVW